MDAALRDAEASGPGSGGSGGGGGGGGGGGAARLHDFADYFDDQETADLTFEVEGRHLHAHRIVLLCSRGSDVFRAMLRAPMREASSAGRPIAVEGIRHDVFRLLVGYLYTGVATVPPELAADLALACEQYMVYPLQLHAVATLLDHLTHVSLWGALSVAASLQLSLPPQPQPQPPLQWPAAAGAPAAAPPADGPLQYTPSQHLYDGIAEFLCRRSRRDDLLRVMGADEFVAFAPELVPRVADFMHLLVNSEL